MLDIFFVFGNTLSIGAPCFHVFQVTAPTLMPVIQPSGGVTRDTAAYLIDTSNFVSLLSSH
jgi:hypothetical protein